jgi:hypothetical protein
MRTGCCKITWLWTRHQWGGTVPFEMRQSINCFSKLLRSPQSFLWICAGAFLVAALFPGAALAQTACSDAASHINTNQQPKLPADEIIRKFAANDTVNREARNHYSYTEDITIQSLTDKNVDGEYRRVTNISFDAQGARVESTAAEPKNSLQRIEIAQGDLDEIRNVMLFMLPTEDLPKYKISYAGVEHIDEIDTYVFSVTPQRVDPSTRQFQGCIWVEDHDLQIVKVRGRVVPDTPDNQSPTFETYRENIDGRYWFPTYLYADGPLHFKEGDIHIREIVKITNYKRAA